MKHYTLTNIQFPAEGRVLALGSFDGFHLGHRAVIDAAVALAKERGWDEINCIEIAGVQGDSTNEARMAGYKAGVEAAGGDFLEDEVQYANAVADQAVTCMEAIMQNHPEGIAIICANNDDMALGAIAALQAAGYNKNDGGVTIPVFGVDATAAAQEAIAAKSMTGTIKQDAVGMANAVVQIAENLGLGKATFENVAGDLEGTWRVNIPYSAYKG